jgi:alkanesulfonate monooxygenase SsuD/methylene tetrahydromethanopterin reductase-like flavin-dependent oxidoreductase (luciferase family)
MLALAGREADAVALGVSPAESEEQILERVATLREAAGERAGRVEISMTVAAVADGGEAEARAAGRIKGRFGVEISDLVRAGSPSVLSGSVDDMCEQLEGRRERLGVSYLSVADDAMEVLAPVVARLAGR